MRVLPVSREALLCFLVSLLISANLYHGNNDQSRVEVVGIGECADCAENNIKASQAFSGWVINQTFGIIVFG
ncbi:hypothetical protein QYF36_014950 [Acer negundo]|nr:hypothetical protein QYF36_014950 [Acer negundo]